MPKTRKQPAPAPEAAVDTPDPEVVADLLAEAEVQVLAQGSDPAPVELAPPA